MMTPTKPRMTKKLKFEILCRKRELQSNIIQNLLFSLGWDIDPRGYIIDQETFTPIQYKKKILKCITDPDPSSFMASIHNTEILFDPFRDRGIATKLFVTFIEKEQRDNDIYVKMYYITPQDNKSKLQVQIESSNKTTSVIESDLFVNANYAYLDVILGMSGYNNVEIFHELEGIEATYGL